MRVKAFRLSTRSQFASLDCVNGLRHSITLVITLIWEMNCLTIRALLTSSSVCNKHSLSFLFTGKESNLEKWTKSLWSPLTHSKRSLKQSSALTNAILQLLINNELKFPHDEIKTEKNTYSESSSETIHVKHEFNMYVWKHKLSFTSNDQERTSSALKEKYSASISELFLYV